MSSSRPRKRARAARAAVDEALVADAAQLDAHAVDAFSLEQPPTLDDASLDLLRLEAPFSLAFLQRVFRTPATGAAAADDVDLPVVPRFHEERFLYQRHSTRLCRFHGSCEGNRLTNCDDGCEPFTLPEYRLPNTPPSSEAQPCLLCLRKLASSHFYSCAVTGEPAQCAPCAPYMNLVDVPGEYRLADTLLCPYTAVPVVKHLRSAYAVRRVGGVLKVEQLYGDPADDDAQDAYFRRGARHRRAQMCV